MPLTIIGLQYLHEGRGRNRKRNERKRRRRKRRRSRERKEKMDHGAGDEDLNNHAIRIGRQR